MLILHDVVTDESVSSVVEPIFHATVCVLAEVVDSLFVVSVTVPPTVTEDLSRVGTDGLIVTFVVVVFEPIFTLFTYVMQLNVTVHPLPALTSAETYDAVLNVVDAPTAVARFVYEPLAILY